MSFDPVPNQHFYSSSRYKICWSAGISSPSAEEGEISSASVEGQFLHLARVGFVIGHTLQFGYVGKCVNTL